MKRPERVKVLGRRFVIAYTKDTLEDGSMGECDVAGHKVTIREGLEPDIERTIIIHEFFHVISDLMGLNLSEKQVEGLETGWYALVRDNPGLARYLMRR